MRIIDAYDRELNTQGTNYFIIDSGSHRDDRDFRTYTWNTSLNNKMRQGDLFIYRKPQKLSENGQFYIYGVGKINEIIGTKRVKASLAKTFQFTNPVFQKELEGFKWEWNNRGKTWEHFWGQYGINQITKNDFVGLINLVDDNDYDINSSDEIIQNEIEIEEENYFVPDSEAYTKTRPWQAAWSRELKEIYGFKCAVCQISTTELLVGSHIVPVSEDKNNRKNPRNGICLCVLHDKAFDKGYITINSDYRIHISSRVVNDPVLAVLLKGYEGKKIFLPTKYLPSIDFLKFHNTNIFIK